MLKLNYVSPKRCVKFTDWLCKQMTSHWLWWLSLKCKEVHCYKWHKRYTSEFSLWNGCPEHTNYSSLKYHKNRGNRLSFNCRLNLYMGYIMILRAVAQRINMTHWMSKSTLMCIHCLQWKIDTAHLSKSGLCFTPQLQWGGNWGICILHSIISFCAT